MLPCVGCVGVVLGGRCWHSPFPLAMACCDSRPGFCCLKSPSVVCLPSFRPPLWATSFVPPLSLLWNLFVLPRGMPLCTHSFGDANSNSPGSGAKEEPEVTAVQARFVFSSDLHTLHQWYLPACFRSSSHSCHVMASQHWGGATSEAAAGRGAFNGCWIALSVLFSLLFDSPLALLTAHGAECVDKFW